MYFLRTFLILCFLNWLCFGMDKREGSNNSDSESDSDVDSDINSNNDSLGELPSHEFLIKETTYKSWKSKGQKKITVTLISAPYRFRRRKALAKNRLMLMSYSDV